MPPPRGAGPSTEVSRIGLLASVREGRASERAVRRAHVARPGGLQGDPIMENARAGDEPGSPQEHPGLPAGTLDAVLAGSPDLVFLCDRGGTFLYANPAGARRWGRERCD